MSAPINPLRGEASVVLGDVEIVMALTMERLGELSSAIGCQTLQDLYVRLMGTEPAATNAAIRILTVRGARGGMQLKGPAAAAAALAAMSLTDVTAIREAFTVLLDALIRPAAGAEDSEQGKGAGAPN